MLSILDGVLITDENRVNSKLVWERKEVTGLNASKLRQDKEIQRLKAELARQDLELSKAKIETEEVKEKANMRNEANRKLSEQIVTLKGAMQNQVSHISRFQFFILLSIYTQTNNPIMISLLRSEN